MGTLLFTIASTFIRNDVRLNIPSCLVLCLLPARPQHVSRQVYVTCNKTYLVVFSSCLFYARAICKTWVILIDRGETRFAAPFVVLKQNELVGSSSSCHSCVYANSSSHSRIYTHFVFVFVGKTNTTSATSERIRRW